MKITSIKAIPQNFILKKPFIFANTKLTHLPYALVQIKTDENILGYGECPAYWNPSGETQKSAIGAIEFMENKLKGKNPFNIEEILSLFDKHIYGAHSAKCGIDMALYDIQGKILNVPVNKLLGGSNYDVKVNAVLSLTNLTESLDSAEKIANNEHEYIKVKVGVNLEQEIKTLSEIQKRLGNKFKYFVDANQGWKTYKAALNAIKKMEKNDLSWIEQPIRFDDWQGLRELKKASTTPIMADESIYTYQDAFKLAQGDYVDMFNIKLAKSGGMYLGKKILAIAQASNKNCMLGSMIESSLGTLANYHFAKSSDIVTCGISAFELIENDFDFGLNVHNGKLKIYEELPGLGYPDEKQLEKKFKR